MPSREYPSRPMLGAAVLISCKGRFLMIRRRREPNKGLWSIPGGLVETGESPLDAAVREAKEETGLTVRVVGLLGVANDIHLDKKGKTKYHFVVVDYLATAVDFEVVTNEESSAFGWFRLDELLSLRLPDNLREMIGVNRSVLLPLRSTGRRGRMSSDVQPSLLPLSHHSR